MNLDLASMTVAQLKKKARELGVEGPRGLGRQPDARDGSFQPPPDCESDRGQVKAVYENFGFTHHSDRQVGPYRVVRYQYQVREALG